jgi:hypothetical protein
MAKVTFFSRRLLSTAHCLLLMTLQYQWVSLVKCSLDIWKVNYVAGKDRICYPLEMAQPQCGTGSMCSTLPSANVFRNPRLTRGGLED